MQSEATMFVDLARLEVVEDTGVGGTTMAPFCALYHEIHGAIWPRRRRHGVHATSIHRLILLV